MKRIAFIVVMALMSFTASASSIRYFTYSQAHRTVQYLNAQKELMIYCGYDYEIETYVLVNEVWMERVNSAYYEIWLYGYDAYTGDEIYMPIDMQCIWLFSAGRMYNAAQYLRFHATVHTPSFSWYIPPYNPYTRRMHAAGYVRSYHYDIHRHGWMPPTPPHHGYGPHTQAPLPPYYMRTPQTPAPTPTQTWTPGLEHPQVNNSSRSGSGRSNNSAIPTTRPSSSGSTETGTVTNSSTTRSGSTTRGTDNAGTTTTTRSTATTPTRSNTGTTRASQDETGTTGTTRSGSTATGTTRSGSTTTGTTRSGSTTSGTTRSGSTATGTTRSGSTTTGTTRSGSSTTGTTRSGSTTSGTTRSGSTATSTTRSGSTAPSTDTKDTRSGSTTTRNSGTTTRR